MVHKKVDNPMLLVVVSFHLSIFFLQHSLRVSEFTLPVSWATVFVHNNTESV